MASKITPLTIRFDSKKDLEAVGRAARLSRVSQNRFIVDALVEKAQSVISAQSASEVNSAAD